MEDFWNLKRFLNSLGFLLLKHMSPEPNATQTTITGDLHIDWNGPVVSSVDHLISASLDGWFGGRGRWHFKTGTNKFYTSEVVDRKKSGVAIKSYMPPSETKKVNWLLFWWNNYKRTMNDCRKNIIHALLFAQNFYSRYFNPESFCPPKPATRKVFAFSASGRIIMFYWELFGRSQGEMKQCEGKTSYMLKPGCH